LRIVVAAALSDQRTIGASSARSARRSGRSRACRRYAASSIAFSTLAARKPRSARKP
jgi:hypothetical protein